MKQWGTLRPAVSWLSFAITAFILVIVVSIRFEGGINTAVLNICLAAVTIPALIIPLVQLRNELSILARTPEIDAGLLSGNTLRKSFIEAQPDLLQVHEIEVSSSLGSIFFNIAIQNNGTAALDAPIVRIGAYQPDGSQKEIQPEQSKLFTRESDVWVLKDPSRYLMAKDTELLKFKAYSGPGVYFIVVQVTGANLPEPQTFDLKFAYTVKD